ncbi:MULTISPECIES: hypothetical protein [unclassified Marinobacter]|jgi:hypothetical protein|uniref:hypothetical protein n=1 Tax=unclassified Marinobacter TaxID=83889 RepID=UPI000C8F32F4|nr:MULTISPECIES: hypothetical protein [unclassified Marinobacter]MAB50525.1 hypothetical protein [Marinobacter sp.]|tara:strand:+ start:1459 stop:1827 length:369 start_codon:yes stop_codon:yes gene_type:complete
MTLSKAKIVGKRKLIALILGGVLSASVIANQALTIQDAETAGFTKRGQQMFQMIGASDGWSGSWSGDKVELYQYQSPEEVKPEVFESAVHEGNLSGWVELCQHKNMLMLSKGKKACVELKKL